MKALIQRVLSSSVTVIEEERVIELGRIGPGLTILIGVDRGDTDAEARRIAEKIAGLRIFPDSEGKMNRDIQETGGEILAISQFTLLADTRKGRRPSFIQAAPPEQGNALYERVVALLREVGITVQTGRFGADMKVEILNDGPVTIMLDTTEWSAH